MYRKYLVNGGEMPHHLRITAFITVISIITSSNKGLSRNTGQWFGSVPKGYIKVLWGALTFEMHKSEIHFSLVITVNEIA